MFRVKRNQILFLMALFSFSFSLFAGDYALVRHMEGKAYVQGSVSNERESLTRNSPLFEGDNIWVTEGHAGILFGDGSALWLSAGSHIEISKFPDPVQDPPFGMRIHLWRGLMLLDVPSTLPGESSHLVMTPAASVKAFRKGLSLIEVETVDRTRLTVLEGSAMIGSSGQYAIVSQDETSYAEYGYEPVTPTFGASQYPEIVEFRDRSIPRPVRNGKTREYVDPQFYPYADDLDYYGGWQQVPSYGHVWFPSSAYISQGWSPYYNGYWHYTPWGTTWISYEPWGWVPFHYGRWTFVIGLGWGWIPDYHFSPAWVSWYWGDGWIGWCPLGYYGPLWEPCGWYSVTVNNIYVTNVTKVVNVNKKGPPPVKPIIPVSKDGSTGTAIKRIQQKMDADVIVTPHGGLNINPSKLADVQAKRVSVNDLKRSLTEQPVSTRDRRIATQSSLDRQDDPVISKKPGGAPASSSSRETPSSPRARDSWDRNIEEPSRVSPSRTEPPASEGSRTRIYRDDSGEPSARDREYPSRGVQRNEDPPRESPSRETPSRDVSVQREQPRTGDSPRSDRSTGSDRHYSPPPSSPQPSSPPPSSSDSQSRPSKQKSSAAGFLGTGTKAVVSSRTSGGGKTRSTTSSSSGSGSSSSGSKKKQK